MTSEAVSIDRKSLLFVKLQEYKNELPAIGNEKTLEEIRERRRNMTNGYGLLHHK